MKDNYLGMHYLLESTKYKIQAIFERNGILYASPIITINSELISDLAADGSHGEDMIISHIKSKFPNTEDYKIMTHNQIIECHKTIPTLKPYMRGFKINQILD